MTNPETIKIDDQEYVRKDSINEKAETYEGMEYCIVRTYSAGVFAGFIRSRDGKEVDLRHSRRIWYWSGAASLSQLANEGTNSPNDCKFAQTVPQTILTEVIEIIPCTQKAQENIQGVPIWEN